MFACVLSWDAPCSTTASLDVLPLSGGTPSGATAQTEAAVYIRVPSPTTPWKPPSMAVVTVNAIPLQRNPYSNTRYSLVQNAVGAAKSLRATASNPAARRTA